MPLVSLDEIREEFVELDDREEQGRYLVEIGERLPPFPEAARREENRVLGCQSKVWLIAGDEGGSAKLNFRADSDAPMVRGLVAMLLATYNGKTPRQIVEFPIEELFEQLHLKSLLSPMRSNGLHSMVLAIRALAEAKLQADAGLEPNGQTANGQMSHGQANNGQAAEVKTGRHEVPQILLPPATALDVERLRMDFPILQRRLEKNRPLIYLDNGASTQRPLAVLDAMADIERRSYSNVHRGGHQLAAESTLAYEHAREAVRRFINARLPQEVLFTGGTTAGINLVARSWGDANVRAGDEIVLTMMEHHSNIVPWQQLAERTGCVIRWVPFTERGELDLEEFANILGPKTKLVAVTAVSNVFGTINPIEEIIEKAHAVGAKVLIDAAQSVPHIPTDVQALDCDFLAFSSHKMCGPGGVGILYGKEAILESMPPFMGGGSMIHRVTLEGFTPASLPHRFEAGTPMIVDAVGLGAAIEYLEHVGLNRIHAYEQMLTAHAHAQLTSIPGLHMIGPEPARKGGIATFIVDGQSASDLAWKLDGKGIAVRAGHHCAMPLHDRISQPGTCRASFYLYNTLSEIDALAEAIRDTIRPSRPR